jgi:uncharacterized DUF497 family protein
MDYIYFGKTFEWNEAKNEWLKTKRGLSFKDIVPRIFGNDLLEIIAHPAPNRYPGRKMFVIRILNYIVLVPFVEDDRTVFLKTIIPSRKMTKLYLGGKPS